MRDLDELERKLLCESNVMVVPSETVREGGVTVLEDSISALANRVSGVYLHVDPDVLDPAEAKPSRYIAPQGVSLSSMQKAIRLVAKRVHIRAAALASYDPTYDESGRTLSVGLALLTSMIEAIAGARNQD